MKLARDTWLVFGRYFGLFIRNPAWVALGVLQPVIYLVLFAPLLGSIAKVIADRGTEILHRSHHIAHLIAP